jgi:endonuclease/exonuclease/phosphatase family metal-dependent hydrolase
MRYDRLKRLPVADRPRVVRNLQALREQLDQTIPSKDASDNLLLASWNIRDLAKTNRRGFGARLPESHFYIAEVLSRFDFVAVQEVNELDEWQRVLDILGYGWDWIATDVTDTALGGNGERLTYLYDRRKVGFQNIAGELVLPAKLLITTNLETDDDTDSDTDTEEGTTTLDSGDVVGKQFRRTPFTAMFQSSWFKFDICTVHIYYGDESGSKLQERIQEIQRVAEFFGKRATQSLKAGRSLILLGDFNVVGADHETMEALLASGFESPKALRNLPTNIDQTKYYDQIVFRTRPGDLTYLETTDPANPRAGAFKIFEHVFAPDQFGDYRDAAAATSNGEGLSEAELKKYYLEWRTYQFSDHLPLWVRLKVNDSSTYLEQLLQ